MFDKLQFWKKDEDSLGGNPFDSPTAEGHPFGADTTNPFTSSAQDKPMGEQIPSFDQQGTNDPFSTQPASMDYTSEQQPADPFAQPQMSSSQATPQTLRSPEYAQAVSEQQTTQSAATGSQYGGEMQKKDVELILSRLDLIKSELDNVQHKLSLLEQQNQKPKW